MNVPETIKNTVYEIERHCNNYFNETNDPKDPERDYPDAFIALATRIYDYVRDIKKDNLTGFSNAGYSESCNSELSSWQKAFSRELAIYKRAKFL